MIGDGANIGAGVIFANYDGVNKSTTTCRRVQLRRKQLRAHRAGARSPTARTWPAGSTITTDVGVGELAVARGRQRNVPGWVARKRAGTKTARAAEAALDRAPARRRPRLDDQRTESRAAGQDQQVTPGGSRPVTGVKKPNEKHLMLFSGRAYPELAAEVADADGGGDRADPGDQLRQLRDLRAVRGVGARLATPS